MIRPLLRIAPLLLLGCAACAKPQEATFASVHVEDPSSYGIALGVGRGLETCGAVPVGPRLAVTALACVREACRASSEQLPGACRLRFTARNGRAVSAKLAVASESDSLALIELRKRVPTWVPLGCDDPWPDESLYVYEGDGAPPAAFGARALLTGTEARGEGGDWHRLAPRSHAPDLATFIDSDRVRRLLASYCSAHPSRHCQEAGCRSANPQPRAKRRGVASAEVEASGVQG